MIYLGDYDDSFPMNNYAPAGSPNAYPWSSSGQLGPYVKNTQIFRSPSQSSRGATAPGEPLSNNRKPQPMSYLANALYALPYAEPTVWGPAAPGDLSSRKGLIGWIEGAYSNPPVIYPSATQTELESVSEIVLLTIGRESVAELDGTPVSNASTESTVPDDHRFSVRVMAMATLGQGTSEPQLSIHKRVLPAFSGGANYAFGDSSAKYLKPSGLLSGQFLSKRRWLTNPN